ncbi:MAG TPA: O-antigen ligase family protein [Candidatus Dormibacteraeota bacterium]|nr:O-antigen ligase family protein [Candidatus Dormibacteraeota bacterium]
MTPRLLGELAAVGMGLAAFGYVGWDGALWDGRYQFALHLGAVAALGGLLAIGLAGGALPRTRIDLPILALLAAFGVATLSAANSGLSARALAGIVATAAMLPVALVALRHRPGWTAAVVTLPILGLSVGALAGLAWRRVEWVLAGGPGLPPVRFPNEGTPFGSVAVPPFVILAALPIALLIPQRTLRLLVLLALAVVGVPLTLLSGSRSAWLAIVVAGLVLVGPAIRRGAASARGSWTWTPRRIGLVLVALLGMGVALAFVAPRLTDATSFIYRSYLWRDTIAAWSVDPLLGIGPGSMPYARQAAAPPLSFPVQQPHSHDVPLGILGDAGLVGLAAALALVAIFVMVAGPWRARRLPGRAAFAVLAGCAVGMLFEDLTFVPGFNLLLILLAAIALADADAVAWRPIRMRPPAIAVAGLGALGLVAVMVVGDAAAVAYRHGTDAAGEGRWLAAEASLLQAVALDPWQPTGLKSLAVAADGAGHPTIARAAAERAVDLSPGDGDSWTNLALLCAADGDAECARLAADRAVETATAGGRQLANAALVLDAQGDTRAADDAYRLSLLTNPLTGLVLPWPRPIEVGAGGVLELGAEAVDLNLLLARRVTGERIDPADYRPGLVRALASAMVGDRAAAEAEAQRTIAAAPGSLAAWDLAALLARHYGEDPSEAIRIGDVLRGRPQAVGPPVLTTLTFDIATFRAYPADGLVGAAQRLLGERLWPWVLEPLLAPVE